MTVNDVTVVTWDQLLLGGGFVRFHLETLSNGHQFLWECDETCPLECDVSHMDMVLPSRPIREALNPHHQPTPESPERPVEGP